MINLNAFILWSIKTIYEVKSIIHLLNVKNDEFKNRLSPL